MDKSEARIYMMMIVGVIIVIALGIGLALRSTDNRTNEKIQRYKSCETIKSESLRTVCLNGN